jgi:hypothetical protein
MNEANQAAKYGVTIRPAKSVTGRYWRASRVAHVPVGANGGQHHVYVDVYGPNGATYRGSNDVRIAWGWEGQDASQRVEPKALEKREPEHMTNIPMDWGQRIWCEVVSDGRPASDRVIGLHTAHDDEGDDVRRGHHSFIVEFQLVESGAPTAPPPDGVSDELRRRLQGLAADLDYVLRNLV